MHRELLHWLAQGPPELCYIMNGIQKHEVVDHSVVESQLLNSGLFELACISLAFVTERIILRCDDERRRQVR